MAKSKFISSHALSASRTTVVHGCSDPDTAKVYITTAPSGISLNLQGYVKCQYLSSNSAVLDWDGFLTGQTCTVTLEVEGADESIELDTLTIGTSSSVTGLTGTFATLAGTGLSLSEAALGSVGAGVTQTAAGHITSGWNKFTIPAAVFTAAATSQTKIIASMPAKTKILEAIVVVDSSFVLAASVLTFAVGVTGNTDVLIEEFLPDASTKGLADADLGTGLAIASIVQGGYRASMTAAVNVVVEMVSDTANLGAAGVTSLSAGSATLYLNVDVAP